MDVGEISLLLTNPETEWIRGRPVQKVSPFRNHSRVQLLLGKRLDDWVRGPGEVGTEWRFRIAPPGEPRRPLVPDIAFVSLDQLRGLGIDEIQAPAFAPSVAVEALSPDDDGCDLASKIDVYLRGGSALVIVVDPARRTAALYDRQGVATLGTGDTLRHAALPEFQLTLDAFFDEALRLPN